MSGVRSDSEGLLRCFCMGTHGFGGNSCRIGGAYHRPSGGSCTGLTTLVPAQPEVFVDGEGGN
jgi:hypothetical protein